MYSKINKGVRYIRRMLHQTFVMDKSRPKQLLFIFGCQRSGTSMFTQLFKNDLNTRIYGQRGLGRDNGLRMRPYDEVAAIVDKEATILQVAKSLPENQNAPEILSYFADAKAIWLYRDYHDVARSNNKRFGRKIALKNLRPIIEPHAERTFASEGVSDQTRDIVARFFSEDMLEFDAHILYWYVRNIIYYEKNLELNRSVRLFKYEDLVANPGDTMRDVYSFLGQEYPGDSLVRGVHKKSVRLGADIEVSPEVEQLCQELLDRFDDQAKKQR